MAQTVVNTPARTSIRPMPRPAPVPIHALNPAARPPVERINGSKGGAKVSVVGVGMRNHAGVAASMFKALADKGINIQLITTSEIKTSVLIDDAYAELAVRALHTYYGLDKPDA